MKPSNRISAARLVLGRIFFVYAVLLFAATLLIVVLPVMATGLFPEPRRSKLLYPIFRVWMSFYMPLVFCPVRRKGAEKFRKGQNYVVVCNHNSFVDVPVTSPWIPGPNKTLAKAEMAKIPIFGTVYTAGSILVNRKSDASRRESFSKMQQSLEQGLHLCLYPEGTRNKTSEPLQAFYDGAFITAVKAQKPIIPALLTNTATILPMKPHFWAWPRSIRFHFLEAVETKGLTMEDVPALKERVRNAMMDHYVKHIPA